MARDLGQIYEETPQEFLPQTGRDSMETPMKQPNDDILLPIYDDHRMSVQTCGEI